jgi:serine phosphatase RsbU (regulator of sigma subunit)
MVIAVTARQTDLFNLVRRRRSMSLPASLQWDLLPPLRIDAPEGYSTGLLEPAYDVGGDSFDHAVNGFTLDVAIMDAMGHGLDSSLTAALAVGSYRHDRREGQPLSVIHRRLDAALAARFAGRSFVTGQLAQLDLRTGVLTWVNAGHPRPLLVRHGRFVDALSCRPSLPWGIGSELAEQAEEQLQPGDVVVFYSDGVVEGRSAEDALFGLDRFITGIERAVASSVSADLVLRRIIHDVLSHQDDRLRDDATILWMEWGPPDRAPTAGRRTVGGPQSSPAV